MSDRTRLQRWYDPRWTYPDQINERNYEKLGQFFWNYLEWRNIAIGYDARLSSQSLKSAFIEGIIQTGKNVIDLGLCSTDMLTFSTGKYSEIDWWVMITASHNPPQYNGLKVCKKYARPVNVKEISTEIISFLEDKSILIENKKIGTITEKNIINDRIAHILTFVDTKSIKPLKIVVDAWNWTAGIFVWKLLEKLNCEVIPMYFEPDGNFPNHEANPLKPENTEDLIQKVKETNADLWVAFDGDADRVMICDETWIMLSGSIITALISQNIIKKNPNCKIVYNTVCGRIVPDTIKQFGWIPVRSVVWHTYIKNMMNEDSQILFAGEHSAHYFFKDNRNADSGSIALVQILEIISSIWKKVSDIRKSYEKYVAITETNFQVDDPEKVYKVLKEYFAEKWVIDEKDWLLINFSDRRFNVRPSSNEPLLRLNLEAKTKEKLDKNFQEIKTIIEQNSKSFTKLQI